MVSWAVKLRSLPQFLDSPGPWLGLVEELRLAAHRPLKAHSSGACECLCKGACL